MPVAVVVVVLVWIAGIELDSPHGLGAVDDRPTVRLVFGSWPHKVETAVAGFSLVTRGPLPDGDAADEFWKERHRDELEMCARRRDRRVA
jgi:hypothetical protein